MVFLTSSGSPLLVRQGSAGTGQCKSLSSCGDDDNCGAKHGVVPEELERCVLWKSAGLGAWDCGTRSNRKDAISINYGGTAPTG
ncbi:hypothetical protein VTK56DRAFT_9906 [Thermocarpiscus australiensis]